MRTIKIKSATVKASYNPDPGDCYVEGKDLDGKCHVITACSDMDTARNLASSIEDLSKAVECDIACCKRLRMPSWTIIDFVFV